MNQERRDPQSFVLLDREYNKVSLLRFFCTSIAAINC